MLNDQQVKCAEFSGKHLLVLAGAGTGKTKTIVARAEYLLQDGIPVNQIVVLSFTRKSAQEIADRIKLSVSNKAVANSLYGKTFHSWCNEIIQSYPDYFPQAKFTLLDEDDRYSAMGLAVGKKFKDSQGEKLNSQIITHIYSYAINTQCSLTESIKHLRYYNTALEGTELQNVIEKDKEIIAPVIKQYISFKQKRRYIDYDDMLNIVADALQKNEVIRNTVTGRWKHILVDEMQDTNPLQYKLLRSFIDKCHLFCVGDDAQSIYGFRGADFKTVHSFTKIVPGSECYKLQINYRSTQEILDVSNWLLEKSELIYNKKLISNRGKGLKPILMHTNNSWDEANFVTDEIQISKEDNERYSDNLVLGRSTFSLSRVEGACLQKKIPYIKLGGTSLMQSAHIRDVVSALRVIINHYDEIAWIRFLKLWPGIGDIKASKIINDILNTRDINQAIDLLNSSHYLQDLSTLPKVIKNGLESINNPPKAISSVFKSMEEILIQKYKVEWDYRKYDFEVLIEVAKTCGSILEFITEYILDPKAESTLKVGPVSEDDVVTLSTIHSAKGLEAKNVHVIDVNPYSYPSNRAIKEGFDAIEEERRCLYVALTRAKDKLTIHRNIKSYRAESGDHTKEIRLNGLFISKSPDGGEVSIIKSDTNMVTFFNHEELFEETISTNKFLELYEESSNKNSTDEGEKLYFLNDLDPALVEVKVTEDHNQYRDQDIEPTEPAEFPEFDFD